MSIPPFLCRDKRTELIRSVPSYAYPPCALRPSSRLYATCFRSRLSRAFPRVLPLTARAPEPFPLRLLPRDTLDIASLRARGAFPLDGFPRYASVAVFRSAVFLRRPPSIHTVPIRSVVIFVRANKPVRIFFFRFRIAHTLVFVYLTV